MTDRTIIADAPTPARTQSPLPGIGVTSFVLGTIALLAFFMPILGIAVSLAGLLCALTGCITAGRVHAVSLRWSVAGLAVCAAALSVNLAMYRAPGRYQDLRHVPVSHRTERAALPVAPPARPQDP